MERFTCQHIQWLRQSQPLVRYLPCNKLFNGQSQRNESTRLGALIGMAFAQIGELKGYASS
jgi:hypothetical protein